MKKKKLKRGRFIVLDGPDGAGKTTQAQLLQDALAQRGVSVQMLREPGGTQAGEAIRALVLEQRGMALDPLAEAFLFQAARAQLVRERILPALEKGEWVVRDRFTLSTLVYQGYAGGIKKKTVKLLAEAATAGLAPDCYLVLWVGAPTGIVRNAVRKVDRMESKGIAFLRKVSDAFKHEAKRHPKKYILIDGGEKIETVQAKIWKIVEPLQESVSKLDPA